MIGQSPKYRLLLWLLLLTSIIITGCQSPPATPTPTEEAATVAATVTDDPPTPTIPAATDTETPSPPTADPEPTASQTLAPPTATPTITSTPSPAATVADTTTPAPSTGQTGEGFIIDRTAIEQFDNIPDEYIEAAANIRLLLRHASVGANIDVGLDCLSNSFDRRPNHCDRELDASEIIYDPKYDRGNWIFEPHSTPNPNPGWYNKVDYFIDRIDGMSSDEEVDVVGFILGYLDAGDSRAIDVVFFQENGDNLPTVHDLEELEAAHPDLTFMWWTMSLARAIGTEQSTSFNQQLREYAIANDKILMDIADIESHAPDGTPCIDNRGEGWPAICDAYTNEVNAGHLNSIGRLRMSKAMWVMMARLAGWDGQ